ncbi:MAG: PD-(D/E)XK motif protein [Rhodanobacter sp.]
MTERPIERWKRLRSSGIAETTLEIPSLSTRVETGYGPVRFALGPEGQPRLLVPCGPGTTLTANRLNGKLSVTLSRLTHAGRAAMFIDIMNTDRGLDPVFAEIADEIVHRVGSGAAPLGAVEGTIADFRELLREAKDQSVTDSNIYGLIGELVVLRNLAQITPTAVEAWTGPYDQRHDFRRRENALEVKTSSRTDATTVSISSCEQLSEPSGGSLVLVHVRVERADKGDLFVAGLVSDILAHGVERAPLEKGLAAVGCLDPGSPEWNRIHCSLEGLTAYRVGPGFPRITAAQFPKGQLPAGVDSIAYRIDLRAAQQFLMQDKALDAAFQGIVA